MTITTKFGRTSKGKTLVRTVNKTVSKYSFVWKKTIERNDKKLDEKLRVFLKEVEKITDEENVEYGDKDFLDS